MRPLVQRLVFPRPRPQSTAHVAAVVAAIAVRYPPAVAQQQRERYVATRRPGLRVRAFPQQAWWAATLPTPPAFDVATIVGPLAQQRDWRIVRGRHGMLQIVSTDWIGANVPAGAVAADSFIPTIRRRRR